MPFMSKQFIDRSSVDGDSGAIYESNNLPRDEFQYVESLPDSKQLVGNQNGVLTYFDYQTNQYFFVLAN